MLIPREHGAYGQLAFPLVTALAIGRPAAGAIALAAAGLAAFLGHEALLVLLGQRGGRAAREQRTDARTSVAVFGTSTLIAGGVAVVDLSGPARIALAVPGLLTMIVAVVVWAGKERTTAGETLVATTLASLALPTALAAGARWVSAATLALVFSSVFITATLAVRAVIASATRSRGPSRAIAGSIAGGVIALLAFLGQSGALETVAPLAALPVSALAFWLVFRPPSPRYLRRVGWTLVAATTLTAIILIGALRS